MSDLAAYLGAAVLAALATVMSVWERRGARRRVRRAGSAFAWCQGCSLALLAPATLTAATGAGIPGLAVIALGDAVRTAAISFLMLLACALRPRRALRPGRCGQAAVAVAMQAGILGLFVLARPRLAADGDVTAGPGGRWPLALRVALFAAYCVWALIELFLALLSHSRAAADEVTEGAADGTLVWGVRLVLAAVCVGMLWALWSYDDIVNVLRHGIEDGSEDVVSNVLGALCAALVLAGTVLGRSGGTVAATTRWLRLWRCYRLLGPLWSAMRTAMPYIAFPQAARPRLAGRLRLEFALYRRVIEIHDGRLVLRPYHHPAVAAWVAQEAVALAVAVGDAADTGDTGEIGDPDPAMTAALIEAATIATALENMRFERRFADAAEAPPGDAGLVLTDLDSEVLWLSRVAWAFRRSPVIPLVLERLRLESERG
ncbi:MAG: hypothetical protein JF587_10250 [Catenulisporales bacterium]|nr:hypothetical protein [Catenulisporales bacterium]